MILKTPEIQNYLVILMICLEKGGYTKDDFTNDFKEMYNDVGLDVRDEHLHQVFDTLSKKDNDGITRTQPVQKSY
jgi:hypothetical protein